VEVHHSVALRDIRRDLWKTVAIHASKSTMVNMNMIMDMEVAIMTVTTTAMIMTTTTMTMMMMTTTTTNSLEYMRYSSKQSNIDIRINSDLNIFFSLKNDSILVSLL
jgi:hypothetical protein